MNTQYLFDRDAEMAVLGACMYNGALADQASESLISDDFGIESHRIIYSAIINLVSKGKSCEEKLVAAFLREKNQLDAVGGRAALSDVLAEGVGVSNEAFEDYIAIIKDKSVKRQLMALSSDIEERIETDIPAKELLDKVMSLTFGLSLATTKTSYEPVGDILARQMEIILSEDKEQTGMATSFTLIDRWTSGGFRAGEFIIIAARPGLGKSSFLTSLAKNMSMYGRTIAFFSLEVSREMVVQNMLCGMAEVNISALRGRYLSNADREKLTKANKRLSELKLFIDDSAALDIMTLRSRARQIKHKHGLDVIIVDYLQLMAGKRERLDNRQVEVANISRGLKLLAKELDVPVIAACQLNRDAANEPPRLSHLRESGSLEQDADDVFLLHIQEKGTPNEPQTPAGMVQIILAKQRSGPTGYGHLRFVKEYALFTNQNEVRIDE